MDMDCTAALKHFFGFDDFLDNQQQIVEKIVQGRELCVVMPTGAGKSLCYQLPILMRPGYGIVVSPLISLMKDQVDALNERGIPAAYINSTVPFSEQRQAADAAAMGDIKLLYVAPERFSTDFFCGFLNYCPPSVMVVDEAHCISQWGHDFRPSYRRLGEMAERFHIPQLCAFTATATPHVREDIRTQLHRPAMEIVVAGFKRPNLAFSVADCNTDHEKLTFIRKALKKNCPTIIYTATRKAVEQLTAEFGIRGYHAGMTDEERTAAQDYFMNDPCPVLAATNAFGMGIDRPDVRQVLHFNLPGSLEAYYQEAGRAGRDGEASECILLFGYRDKFVQEFLIDMSNPTPDIVRNLYRELLRRGREENTTTLEVTLSELVPFVEGAKSDTQLSAAMSILEKANLVERGYRRNSRGTLTFHGDLEELRLINQMANTQRSRFISRCIQFYGRELLDGVSCTIDDLSQVVNLNTDQIKRVLSALSKECLQWKTPFSGRSTELLYPEITDPQLDYSAMEAKREFEMERLEDVLNYARTRKCRQRFLINYFGEDAGEWSCTACDMCNDTPLAAKREANDVEVAVVHCILCAVQEFNGRLGSGKISQILAGAKSAELSSRGLNNSPWFGKLRNLKQNGILQYIKSLEADDCLMRDDRSGYPCLRLTGKGFRVLSGEERTRLTLPEELALKALPTRKTAPRQSNPAKTEFDSLHTLLRELRTKLAHDRGVASYQIFSNATLDELADKKPLTIEEAMTIKGIGQVKAQTVLPLFLEAIRHWQKTNGTDC
ncbi:MAG: RecQ family ATP-dependent DNA helicase [Lentisphaeria bacterium]|nr:RecQ family ATP-dependent DNA helicase [Lentisphaeria bacterium]